MYLRSNIVRAILLTKRHRTGFLQFKLDFAKLYPEAATNFDRNFERVTNKLKEIVKKQVVTRRPDEVRTLIELDARKGIIYNSYSRPRDIIHLNYRTKSDLQIVFEHRRDPCAGCEN